MTKKTTDKDYRKLHAQPGKGRYYDSNVYSENSAHNSLWQMEVKYLTNVIERMVINKHKYMDFACGTGRIIQAFANSFSEAFGIDISEPMLSVAKEKDIKARFLLGDITENPDIVGSDFDLITAFRFFLNAQDSLRLEVIRILTKKLSSEGVLIFNIHNSRPSFLWLQNSFKNLFTKRKIPSLSRKQVEKLVKQAGLEIIKTKAFGIVPKAAHILLGAMLWQRLDKALQKVNILQNIGSDVIYICQVKK